MTTEELVKQGYPVVLDPSTPPETRLIPSELIVQSISRGMEVKIENAIIAGDFNLRNITVPKELSLTNCELQNKLDAAYTTFTGPFTLVNCVCLGPISFDSAKFQLDATIDDSVFKEMVLFSDAEISGVFSGESITFEKDVDFIRTLFKKNATLRNSKFNGKFDFSATFTQGVANFSGTVFKCPATFDSARVTLGMHFVEDGETRTNPANFESTARFAGAEVATYLELSGVGFSKEVSFNRVKIRGSLFMRHSHFGADADFTVVDIDGAIFCVSSVFAGSVMFPGSRIGLFANFAGTVFKEKADFRACRVLGNVVFRQDKDVSAALFEKEATFRGLQVGGDAEFQGTKFLSTISLFQAKIDGDGAFRGMEVSNDARFTHIRLGGQGDFQGTIFSGDLNFTSTEVAGAVNFSSAGPLQAAAIHKRGIFTSCTFKQGAYFQGTTFNGDADFHLANFGAEANYVGATFTGLANFENAHFEGFTDFGSDSTSTGAMFKADVSFKHARFDGDTRFDNAILEAKLILNNAHFGTLFLGTPGGKTAKLNSDVDLRGCDYKAIYCDHKTLLFKIDGSPRVSPYQRQVYVQLEQYLRKAGEDQAADDVHLARRRAERDQYRRNRNVQAWLGNVLYGVLARYGIHPYRLLVASVILVVIGTVFYSFSDTVVPPEKGPLANRKPPTVLSPTEAFAVSLHSFLPINISSGSQWQPSPIPKIFPIGRTGCQFEVRPATVCTWLLQIPGWILVPLGVAAITGSLRRTSAT
jgi:hypothetical protein